MKKNTYYLIVSFILILLSLGMFVIHYLFFGQGLNTAYYSFMNLCFIPINSLVVTIILDKLIDYKSKKEREEKLNMLIGIFFTEIGVKLMCYIISADDKKYEYDFDIEDLKTMKSIVKTHNYSVNMDKIELNSIKNLLIDNNNLLINLVSNENLLQNEIFTNLIMATLHLKDEILFFENNGINECGKKHIENDVLRVYKSIIIQWISYLDYLQKFYPFLYSNAVRKNPFKR